MLPVQGKIEPEQVMAVTAEVKRLLGKFIVREFVEPVVEVET